MNLREPSHAHESTTYMTSNPTKTPTILLTLLGATFAASGCGTSSTGEKTSPLAAATTASTDGKTCQPELHATQGKTEEQSSPEETLQRYRFVGQSDDGTRVAVLLSHFGPSSGAPFANLAILELGKTTPIFARSLLQFDGQSEEDLEGVEDAVLEESQAALVQHGIHAASSPAPVPWCRIDGRISFGTTAATMKIASGICPVDGAPRTTWSMCMGDQCADGIAFTGENATNCSDSPELSFVDTFRAGDILWFVAQRRVRMIDPLHLTMREVGAMRLAP